MTAEITTAKETRSLSQRGIERWRRSLVYGALMHMELFWERIRPGSDEYWNVIARGETRGYSPSLGEKMWSRRHEAKKSYQRRTQR